jgi:hypothetical protein
MMKELVMQNQIDVVDIMMVRSNARVIRMELKKNVFTIKILVKKHVQN